MYTHADTYRLVEPYIASHQILLSPQLPSCENVEEVTVCGRLEAVTIIAPTDLQMTYEDILGDPQPFSDVYLTIDDGLGKILVVTDESYYKTFSSELSSGDLLLITGHVFQLDRYQLHQPEPKAKKLFLASKKKEVTQPKLIPHPEGGSTRLVLADLTIL